MTRLPRGDRARAVPGPALHGVALVGPVMLGAALLLGGCVAPRLADERRQAPYAELLGRFEAAPRERWRERVQVGGGEPVHVALEFLDGDKDDVRPVVVLEPGVLADGRTWRFLMGELAGEFDLLAVDPPGTGASDVPAPGPSGAATYSPTWLAAHMLGALEAWDQRHGARRRYVLAGHSLGATVVLRALADPELVSRHHGVLARVTGAVLLAPADVATQRRSQTLRDIACLSDCLAAVSGTWGVMQKQVREGVRDNVVRPEQDALASEALRIEALLGRPSTRHAAQAMLRRFQPLRAGFEPDVAAAQRLADQERAITMPILLLWGACDETLPPSESLALRERLTTERFVLLEHVGHPAHQEGVFDVAREMRDFVSGLDAQASPR